MAKVMVWYPKLKARESIKQDGISFDSAQHAAYSFVENVGHASLLLDRLADPVYVSWWPNRDHTSFATPSLSQDEEVEGGMASSSVALDCLDEESVKHWWNRVRIDGSAIPYRAEFFPADNKWTLDRNNCSHMVMLALRMGGAERFVPSPAVGDMMTPFQILGWAKAIQAVCAVKKIFN